MTKKTKPRAPASFNVSDLVGEEETTPRQPKAENQSKTKAGTKRKTKPRAVRSDAKVVLTSDSAAQRHGVNELADLAEELTPPAYTRERQSGSWLKRMAVASFLALVSLGLALWIDGLVSDLFTRADWLGWIAVGLTAILIGSLALMVAREIVGLRRIRKVETLRQDGLKAAEMNDLSAARPVVAQLMKIYRNRPAMEKGLAAVEVNAREVMDGRDLVALCERELLVLLDRQIQGAILSSAKRVSVVTTVSPRALIDIAYVLMENTRLIRRIAETYGGAPGTLGFWRLARKVLTHLAITGSIAIGDGIVQQMLGHGVASKVSARLGEGIINGMLTVRIGIAAMDICRPLPFTEVSRPGISDFLGELVSQKSNTDA